MSRPRLYDWDTWLDASRRTETELVVGRHLAPDTDLKKLKAQLYVQASRRGVAVRTRVSADGRVLLIKLEQPALGEQGVGAFFDGQVHYVRSDFQVETPRYEVYRALVARGARHTQATGNPAHIDYAEDLETIIVHAVTDGVVPREPCPFEGLTFADLKMKPSELDFIRDGSSRWADYNFNPEEEALVLRLLGWKTPGDQPPDPVTRSDAATGLAEKAAREEGIERTRRNQEADRLKGALAAGAPPPWVTQ